MLRNIGRTNVNAFANDAFFALASYLIRPETNALLPDVLSGDDLVNQMFSFYRDLSEQPSETIDMFIRDNPGYSLLGKVLLSQEILLNMYSVHEHQMNLKTFAEWEFNGRRNWYHVLVNALRAGANDAEDLKKNRLTVLTFNYDLSLERGLAASLPNSQRFLGADVNEVVEILHVNGAPPELPDRITDAGEFIVKSAQRFALVEEEVESDLSEVRDRAREAVANAHRVFVMGFHFDATNVTTIGLRFAREKGPVFCLNFNGNAGVRKRILDLNIPESSIWAGTPEKELHIDEALANGFLEQ